MADANEVGIGNVIGFDYCVHSHSVEGGHRAERIAGTDCMGSVRARAICSGDRMWGRSAPSDMPRGRLVPVRDANWHGRGSGYRQGSLDGVADRLGQALDDRIWQADHRGQSEKQY